VTRRITSSRGASSARPSRPSCSSPPPSTSFARCRHR
jgi:hypothetical protein